MLTVSAIDDSLTEDEPLSGNLKNISVKDGLRTMLDKKNAAFAVKHGALMIISKDDVHAEQYSQLEIFDLRNLLDSIAKLEKDRIVRSQQASKDEPVSDAGQGDKAANQNSNRPKAETAQSILSDVIQDSIDTEIWRDNGGLAVIKIVGGRAVINGTYEHT